ncbi:hypothetical protein [Microbacterium sp.]|uniref:hypothetical protein n=1 Tax=Microbacterium sp. TaxID=51671 RepID=UPI0039E52A1C
MTNDEERDAIEGEEVFAGDPRVHVLPDAADVYADDQLWLARVADPLLSIELSALDPSWTGRVHLLSPVEPEDGLLGDGTEAHHDDYAGENWISFRLQDDGRYAFLGQRAFFAIEADQVSESLTAHYEEAAAEYEGARRRWAREGRPTWPDHEDPSRTREGWDGDLPVLDALGGEPGYGNWASYAPPAAFVLDESDDATPVLRLADGRPFTFVGATSGYPWRSHGADAILVFFEPETRTVAMTFDWS